jgi:uncharacterized protein YndB with AHSA1/START domain
MTKNTVNEKERMVVTRVFDAPRALVWKAWTDPQYVMQWWGPKSFTAPFCKIDFRVGGKFLGWRIFNFHSLRACAITPPSSSQDIRSFSLGVAV